MIGSGAIKKRLVDNSCYDRDNWEVGVSFIFQISGR